jgi:hypothetical protein
MKFKYASHEYELDYFPKCNLCNNDLIFKKRKNRKNNYEYYEIKKCSFCIYENKFDKLKSLVPEQIYKNQKEKYKKLIQENHVNNIEIYLKKGFTEEESRKIISEKQSEKSSKIKNRVKITNDYLRKKGYNEDKIKKLRLACNGIDYWMKKGYSEDESKQKISEFQSKISKGTIRSGTGKYPNQIEYWIKKGYSKEESKKIISRIQIKFSLKICIEKYGEEIGKLKWLERQEKWLKSNKKSNFSKVSQKLFWSLYEKINKNDEIYFASLNNGLKDDSGKNNEYRLKLKNKIIKPDFFIKNKNKIIEFDGTYYHRKNTENRKRDLIRDEEIIKNGYFIFHVTEYDYKENKEKIINDCLMFLNT